MSGMPGEDNPRLYNAYVWPFYLKLLNGNLVFLGFDEKGERLPPTLPKQIADAARSISDEQLNELLAEAGWRSSLPAAWFIGLTRRSRYVDQIGELLLASEMCFAGQGYCMALGLIGGERCREYLHRYLWRYLPLRGRLYDQHWAIGALTHLEGTPPRQFLIQRLWEEPECSLNPLEGIQRFRKIVSYLQRHQMVSPEPLRSE